jgi:sulfhydrogenase subunit beta (sulfur reductase)
MDKILAKKSLAQWLSKLDGYALYAPVPDQNEHDIWNYDLITDPKQVNLDFPNTVQSPKKLLFPQKETMLTFETGDDGIPVMSPTVPDPDPFVVLGVRPCDAKALTLYDQVFGGDYTDPYYWARRDKGVMVGLTCIAPPSPNCFCPTVDGSPYSTEGLDLLMTDLGENLYMESLTKKGDALLGAGKALFKTPAAKDKQAVQKVKVESEKKIERQVKNLNKVPAKLKDMFEADLWEDEAMSCLRCGICTYLCPTCHCFDIADELSTMSPVSGKRVRTWDTCQFPDFTMHSSGHNPRPDKAARLRQRIMHKFYYFVENYGAYQCTGCGRCVSLCPVGIDIIEVLAKVRDHG